MARCLGVRLWTAAIALRMAVCGGAAEIVQHGHVRMYSKSASLCKHWTLC